MSTLADRVKETTTTTGTGTLSLGGAPTGFRTFSAALGNGVATYYTIQGGSEWEVGIGTTGAGTLSRDTVLASSNAGSLVPLSAGTKDVFVTIPAARAALRDTPLTILGTSSATGAIRLAEDTDNGTNYVAFAAPATIASDVTWTLPAADGTSGQVLSTNGSGTLSWAAAGAGTKTFRTFTPLDNQPPATNFATLDTRNSVALLDFDAATDEAAVFVGVVPQAAVVTSGIKAIITWTATSATSGDCVWAAQWEKLTTDIDSDSFDTATTATTTTNGTSGVPNVTTITCTTIDSLAAGDFYRLKIYRDADAGGDTMTGDAELIAVEVQAV